MQVPPSFKNPSIGYIEKKGGIFMSGFGCGSLGYCAPWGPGGYGPGCEPVRESYGGSTFVLIVVLFILLIIVGRSFC